MQHDEYLEQISAALDGELSAEDWRDLEQHLKTCPACAALYRDLSAQSAALRELDCDPPEDLKAKILQGLPAQTAPKRKRKTFRWAALASCAVLALVIGGTALLHGRSTSTSSGGSPMAISNPGEGIPAPYSNEGDIASEGSAQPRVIGGQAGIPVPGLYLTGGQAIRVSYGNVPVSDTALVIGSAESLQSFLSAFPLDDLTALQTRYDDAFFAEHSLVAAVVEAGSGSIAYSIPDQQVQDTLEIQYILPETGTCDMASWLLIAEGDRATEDGRQLAIQRSPVAER